MSEKKKKVEIDRKFIASYAIRKLHIDLNTEPEQIFRKILERDYKVLREAWIKAFSEAEQYRQDERKRKLIKQNPTGFLKDIGLKALNKKVLVRLAMLRYNGISDYPYVYCGEERWQYPHSREDMAENFSLKIRPPTGQYVGKLRAHMIEVLEEKLNRKLDLGEFTDEGNAVATFLEDVNIYELIADLN
jgi:hypothetical protein